MENVQILKQLRDLYRLQSFGFTYYSKPKEPILDEKFHMQLPKSLSSLNDIVHNCSLCSLSKSRKNVVFGEGNESATVMFVGEGPGSSEDESGRPFVGKSGQLLTKIIETTLDLKREDVYIANIVKCRPPLNRVPSKEEAQTCLPYILKQIEIVSPKIIVTLGATAYQYLSGDYDSSISKIRGEMIEYENALLMPTFHPSFLLRNPSAKRYVFNDMKKIRALL